YVSKAKERLMIVEAQERQREEKLKISMKITQAASLKEEAEKRREEAERMAYLKKKVMVFRKGIRAGDDSHCGLVIEVKTPLVKIQTIVGEYWFKVSQIYPAGIASCIFSNNVYQHPEMPF
ncbi:MAG TPA: hypothetical protein VFW53_10355, partial [Gallionella sp.]|nr:hypothetical protein [Gallionella sp.]